MRLPEKSLLGRARWYPTVTSLCGKEAENLAHNALALIRLEEVLRMGRAVKDDQLFRFGGFFIIRGPSPLASSRVTMNSEGHLSFSAGPFGWAPSSTTRSTSPGCEEMHASAAAPPPMLPPTTETLFAPFFRG